MHRWLLAAVVSTGITGIDVTSSEPWTRSEPWTMSETDATRARRADAIARAQVWKPTQVSAMDIRRGPDNRRTFAFRETVTCDYVRKDLAGASPKFACLSEGDELKVKFGSNNAEVYAEVAATRLLWALGFGADRMYPVRVICRGCPEDLPGIVRSNDEMVFDPASIERKMPGHPLEPDSSWAWRELDNVSEAQGGAPIAHRDALKLLAVFLQHTDTKPEQQRIVCRNKSTAGSPGEACLEPFMMINDLGLTFGRANRFNANEHSMNLAAWAGTPVWKKGRGCVGNLPESITGTLGDPAISEEGRAFLADLLLQLSDEQIDALFQVSRVALRPRNPERVRSEFGTVAEWADTFKRKRADIVDTRCADLS